MSKRKLGAAGLAAMAALGAPEAAEASPVVDAIDAADKVMNAGEHIGEHIGSCQVYERIPDNVMTQVREANERLREHRIQVVQEEMELRQAEVELHDNEVEALDLSTLRQESSHTISQAEILGGLAIDASPIGDARRILNGEGDRKDIQGLLGVGLRVAGQSTVLLNVIDQAIDVRDGYREGQKDAHLEYASGVAQLAAEGVPGYGRSDGFIIQTDADGNQIVTQFETVSDVFSNDGQGMSIYVGVPGSMRGDPAVEAELQRAADEAFAQAQERQLSHELAQHFGADFVDLSDDDKLARIAQIEAGLEDNPEANVDTFASYHILDEDYARRFINIARERLTSEIAMNVETGLQPEVD